MRSLLIKTESFEFNITKFGSYFFSNGDAEFFLTPVADLPWWPHHHDAGINGGVFTCCGWQLTYDRGRKRCTVSPRKKGTKGPSD
jgi:hypothetical protein